MKELFGYQTGSLATGLSPRKYLGQEVTVEIKPM
jgi:hypothetical protein